MGAARQDQVCKIGRFKVGVWWFHTRVLRGAGGGCLRLESWEVDDGWGQKDGWGVVAEHER